jgi:hypothetical protein
LPPVAPTGQLTSTHRLPGADPHRPACSLFTWWLGTGGERWARRLLIAAAALLVLDSAGTLQVGYALTPSYLLVALACLLGAPQLIARRHTVSRLVVWLALALLGAYLLAAAFGHAETIAASGRAGHLRQYAYLVDLGVGLASMLLVAVLFGGRSPAPLARAVAVAGGLAGAYGLYQWFALRYGLPLRNINNTIDSNGITTGASQGVGLFGSERVRGTFLEPHFLAAFLAGTLPLQVWAVLRTRGLERTAWAVGAAVAAAALLLTDSTPGWAALILGTGTAGLLAAIGRGRVVASAALALSVAAVWIAAVPAITDPGLLASLTGRSAASIDLTTSFRTHIWSVATQIWAHRPVLGNGPGQSSVRLASALSAPAPPRTLASAQGIWAAALIDAGVVGLALWVYLIGSVVVAGGASLLRRPTLLRWAAVSGAVAVTLEVAISGDRLGPAHWLMLGLLLAASRSPAAADGGEPEEEPG